MKLLLLLFSVLTGALLFHAWPGRLRSGRGGVVNGIEGQVEVLQDGRGTGLDAFLIAEFEDGPYPGSARPAPGGAAPTEEFVVKGSERSKLYHTAESPFYGGTEAEVWFRSEADAERAGFAAWRRADPRW